MISKALNSPSPLLSTGFVLCTGFSFVDVFISSSVLYGLFSCYNRFRSSSCAYCIDVFFDSHYV